MKKWLLMLLFLVTCDNQTIVSIQEPYSFNLSVLDESGNPLGNTDFMVRYIVVEDDGTDGLNLDNSIQDSNSSNAMFSFQVPDPTEILAENFYLYNNAPNPFNPTTSISYDIAESSTCSLSMYNLEDQLVLTLFDEYKIVGPYDKPDDGIVNCNSCDNNYKAGIQVFKYQLVCGNNNNFLYSAYKHMVQISGALDLDQLAIAGTLDDNGSFSSKDKIWFPTLFDLPEFKEINEEGEEIGSFNLQDLVKDKIEILITVSGITYVFDAE